LPLKFVAILTNGLRWVYVVLLSTVSSSSHSFVLNLMIFRISGYSLKQSQSIRSIEKEERADTNPLTSLLLFHLRPVTLKLSVYHTNCKGKEELVLLTYFKFPLPT
jgi:hypothetical protein